MRDVEDSPAGAERESYLDGIRGIAILLVFCAHLFRFEPDNRFWALLNWAMKVGWIGVDLFFVLSGFLITRILIAARGRPHYFRNFYMRRTLRIFPAYYAVLVVLFFVVLPNDPKALAAGAGDWSPWFFLYVQNLAMVFQGEWAPWRAVHHFWSLAIEEQFYWFWPVLVLWVPLRFLRTACLVVIALAVATKLLLVYSQDWALASDLHTLARMDALAMGAWIAAAHNRPVSARGALTAALFGAFIFVAVTSRNPAIGGQVAGMVALSTFSAPLMFAGLLYWVRLSGPTRIRTALAARPLRFLGRYSYGMYLLHLPLQHYLQAPIAGWLAPLPANGTALATGMALVALTTLAAMLMFHGLEQPMLRFKHYFPSAALQKPVVTT